MCKDVQFIACFRNSVPYQVEGFTGMLQNFDGPAGRGSSISSSASSFARVPKRSCLLFCSNQYTSIFNSIVSWSILDMLEPFQGDMEPLPCREANWREFDTKDLCNATAHLIVDKAGWYAGNTREAKHWKMYTLNKTTGSSQIIKRYCFRLKC